MLGTPPADAGRGPIRVSDKETHLTEDLVGSFSVTLYNIQGYTLLIL